MAKNYLSIKQVAFILKVHPLTIRRYIRDGKLKATKIGGNVRVDENDLENFSQTISPISPNTIDGILIKNARKTPSKQFSIDDPFLRLQGRGASLDLSERR